MLALAILIVLTLLGFLRRFDRERKLAASVKPLLSESDKANFAVGYFFISGFKFIADELEKISELSLLIGNVSDSRTVEQLAESHSAAQLLERTRKREFANQKEREAAVDEASMAIRTRIEQLSQTDEDERVISLLVKLIEEKRFVIRVYTKSRLHSRATSPARAYFLRFQSRTSFLCYDGNDADEISACLRCCCCCRGCRHFLFCRRASCSRANRETGAGRIESETREGDRIPH